MEKTRIRIRSNSLIHVALPVLCLMILSGIFVLNGCVTPDIGTPGIRPETVANVERIQPFQLENAFRYDWRSDKPDVRSGLLVVLQVDTSMVRPRNLLEPVLYAGKQTVQRLNQGYESGYVIGIIPEQINLSKDPVWFGTPELPERINAEMIENELQLAIRAGIAPSASIDFDSITKEVVVARDLATLLREYAAELVEEFSPQEKWLADTWRLPETGSN